MLYEGAEYNFSAVGGNLAWNILLTATRPWGAFAVIKAKAADRASTALKKKYYTYRSI